MSHRRAPDPTGTGRTETLSEVIERADQALYRAKRGGRNQAVAAQAPTVSRRRSRLPEPQLRR